MATAALSVSNIGFSHGRKRVLDDVSLAIRPSEVVILLGPNGAGKTTLFSLICGLYRADAGSIQIAGVDLAAMGAKALAPLGIVFQAQTLDLDLSVRQNLRYFCALRGLPRYDADRRIEEELSRLDMADRIDEKVRALNGGHRRRVEIARSLLHQPSILLLDEPTVGLDIPTRNELIASLHARAGEGGTALLWATHLIDEVEPTDRVVILHRGRIVGEGHPAELAEVTGTGSLDGAFAKLTASGGAA